MTKINEKDKKLMELALKRSINQHSPKKINQQKINELQLNINDNNYNLGKIQNKINFQQQKINYLLGILFSLSMILNLLLFLQLLLK